MTGPLAGLRVVEIGSIGPGPHAAMMLADLGADVVRVDRPGGPGVQLIDPANDAVLRGRRSAVLDLKNQSDLDGCRSLIARADVLLEGFRPGVMERLGLGPDEILAAHPKLIYGRMTGWGQSGPLAHRAGHDINYLAVTGALHTSTPPGSRPFPALNLVGDLGGGSMLLLAGVLSALFERSVSGRGQVVDAAIVDGVGALMAMYWNLVAHGEWSLNAGSNLTDGAAPFYRTYRCADGRDVAVGAVEPQFYAALLAGLGLTDAGLPTQLDRDGWPLVHDAFAGRFATRNRDAWAEHFADSDACVSPVLRLDEVGRHPHVVERQMLATVGGEVQPAPAPRFSRSRPEVPRPPRQLGQDTAQVLSEWCNIEDHKE